MTQSCPNISLPQFKKPIRDCYLMMHDFGGNLTAQGKEKSKIDLYKLMRKYVNQLSRTKLPSKKEGIILWEFRQNIEWINY
ncbi:hypothetical protein BpHYR1_020274 [Brachionus plicatilis]|uniref:Uncharacterized protein n=1 Tax=Brachionus plicatilis TaxID=10195 RepID=A0A3M7RYM6_BRAPC|nr:hypothetical protein BpHYR1_020274 [Brachionus plicatilis]